MEKRLDIYLVENMGIKSRSKAQELIRGGFVTCNGKKASKTGLFVSEKDDIKIEHKGKIIVGGSLVTAEALNRAVEVGVKGVIVGGYDAEDLKEFLGYDLGVAITGTEEKGITLVVTEGFGKIQMAKKTYDLLKQSVGMKTSINGATQIRAGVIRPEVVIPHKQNSDKKEIEKSIRNHNVFWEK